MPLCCPCPALQCGERGPAHVLCLVSQAEVSQISQLGVFYFRFYKGDTMFTLNPCYVLTKVFFSGNECKRGAANQELPFPC